MRQYDEEQETMNYWYEEMEMYGYSEDEVSEFFDNE